MPELTIKNFKGMNLDEGTWADGYSKYNVGMDFYGLARDASQISFPGILQGYFQVSAGSQAASPSAITELVTGFAVYNGQDFAIGTANPGRIYRRDSNSWKWVSAITVSAAAGNSASLHVYGANLYYTQQAYLGQYDNTNGNANFQALGASSANIRIMKTLNGNLYVANDRYVSKYDGTTWTSTALTLPSDFFIRSMEVFGDLLYLMADNGQVSALFTWDGSATTYNTPFYLTEEKNAPSLIIADGKLWVIPNRGVSSPGLPIYIFNGSEFEKVMTLPLQRVVANGLTEYASGLLIASNDDSTALYEDGVAGVWSINRHSASYPYYASLLFPLRDQLTNKTLGAISPAYIAAQDVTTSTYEVFEVQGSSANTTSLWQSLPIDAGSTSEKTWNGIKINIDKNVGSGSIVVKYRLDHATSFTTLKSAVYSSTDWDNYIPIGRSSRTIDIRIEASVTAGQRTTRIHSIMIKYKPTGK